MGILLVPEFEVVASVQPTWSREELLSQTGFFGADIEFAYRHASRPLRTILDAIPSNYHESAKSRDMELNIDVRIHELLKGDYPASPGWHCDSPQRETAFSDDIDTTPVARSLVANVSSNPFGTSNTIFATEEVWLDDDSMTNSSWRELDDKLSADLSKDFRHFSNDGELVEFSCFSPHCVQPAQGDGVRMFVRISQWVKPDGFSPGLTRSEQVYRTTVFA